MRSILFHIMFLLLTATPLLASQGESTGTSVEPFKLGTFNIGGVQQVGIVLRDSLIVEMNSANAALEGDATYPAIPMPADMLELIGRYEYGLKVRLYEIVNELVANDRLTGSLRPTYVRGSAHLSGWSRTASWRKRRLTSSSPAASVRPRSASGGASRETGKPWGALSVS